ncbi:Vomp family autotransporter [Bartonella pachyuromydis]|uniref:Surface protein/Bartonella adhesin n=1 Tax=Bartonella pachyuromydis TaxID=931097 RepID=A0ABP8VE09_9HYPH
MKKLCTKSAGIDLKFSRFLFIKVLSLTSIAALLSSVSPVLAKNLDSKEEISTNIKKVAVAYPKSVISAYDTSASYLEPLYGSKENYVTVLNTVLTPKVSASTDDSDYVNFLTSTLSDGSDDSVVVNTLTADGKKRSKRAVSTEEEKKQSIISPQLSVRNSMSSQQLAQHDENTEIIGVFNASRDDSTAIAQLDAGLQRANTNVTLGGGTQVQKQFSVAVGYMAHAVGESSTALGGEYNANSEHGENDYTTASGNYSTALGSVSKATANGATAVGHRAFAKGKQSISMGFYSEANKERSVTLGDYAVTEIAGGVALGSASVSNVAAGVEGYSPLGKKGENADFVWKSTQGAVSVGDISKSKTRQIGGVAAGSADTDAVNIAQLKSLQTYVDKGWKLSVGGENAEAVGIDDTVDFAAGSSNFEIIKGIEDNNIKFDLAKNITLDSLTAGTNTLDATGLKITDGPQITAEGMNAAGRKITGLADGRDATDAVNFAQLQKVEKQVAANSFVKQDDTTKYITIGKDTDGDKIDITNISGANRIISGVADAKNNNDAVNKGQFDTSIKAVNNEITNKYNELTQNITNITQQVKGDALLWSAADKAFSAQHREGETKTNNKITFLANGDITESSADAINGSQLYSTSNKLAGYFGGGAEYKDGEWSAPTFTLKTVNTDGEEKDETYPDVAKALAGVSSSLTNVQNKITNEITNQINNAITKVEGESFIQQDKETNRFTIGAKTEGTEINIANKSGKDRIISGVADAKNNNDAINKGQLDTSIKDVNNEITNKYNELTQNITNITQQVKGDALLWSTADKAFSAQHGEGETKTNSRITFLANGDITKNSMDAINGSQLYSVINSLSGYFGGGAGYQNGEWKDPTFYVSQFKNDGNGDNKKDYHDVAGAFEGVNDSMKNINDRINNVEQTVSTNGLNWNETEQAFDARHDGVDSKITHVADGDVSKGSKDAVNGGQLWETNEKVSKVEKRVDTIGQQVKNIENTVTNDAVKYDKNDKGDKINKVTLAGVNESDPIVLDNVASGDVSKNSKQAVTGSQLWETNQQIDVVLDKARTYTNERFNDIINHQMGDVINEVKSYTDMKFDALNYSIEGVRKEARQAAAIGIAVANLRYNETPGKLSVGFGTGLWRNKSAFAFGAGYTSESGSVLSNVSVTNSGGHWGIGAGFNMTLN